MNLRLKTGQPAWRVIHRENKLAAELVKGKVFLVKRANQNVPTRGREQLLHTREVHLQAVS